MSMEKGVVTPIEYIECARCLAEAVMHNGPINPKVYAARILEIIANAENKVDIEASEKELAS